VNVNVVCYGENCAWVSLTPCPVGVCAGRNELQFFQVARRTACRNRVPRLQFRIRRLRGGEVCAQVSSATVYTSVRLRGCRMHGYGPKFVGARGVNQRGCNLETR
jgi:hypothetical protein